MRMEAPQFYARELSHVEITSVSGKWTAQARYVAAGPVDLDIHLFLDTVVFYSSDDDAADDANTCDSFVVDRGLMFDNRIQLAEHLARSRDIPLSHRERMMLARREAY